MNKKWAFPGLFALLVLALFVVLWDAGIEPGGLLTGSAVLTAVLGFKDTGSRRVGAVMAPAQFGDPGNVDVEAHHADAGAGKGHGHGQPDIAEADDRNFPPVSQPKHPSPQTRETITGMRLLPQ